MQKRACLVCESKEHLEDTIDLCASCFYPGRILFYCQVCKKREFIVRSSLGVVREAVRTHGHIMPERESLVLKVNFCTTCRSDEGQLFNLRVIAYGKALN